MSSNIIPSTFQLVLEFIDFILVYLLTYRLLSWLKKSHAMNLIKGVFIVFLIYLTSVLLKLTILNWVLEKFTTVILIVVVIIFQPELRKFLERIGSTGKLFEVTSALNKADFSSVIQQILKSVDFLAKEKIGAIMVLEGSDELQQFIDTGIKIEGELNSEILSSIFWPGSPTHDGAVIINGGKIKAAGCFLPITENPIQDRRLGTRHRAALGISEVSDAVVIVISEESGVISLIETGTMTRYLTKEALESRLFSIYKN